MLWRQWGNISYDKFPQWIIKSKNSKQWQCSHGKRWRYDPIALSRRFQGPFLDESGTKVTIQLSNVGYSPQLSYNLLSITKALAAGMNLTNENKIIILQNNNTIIKSNKITLTSNGYLPGIKLHPEINNTCLIGNDKIRSYYINDFHQALGHPCEKLTRKTEQQLHIQLTGEFLTCEDCSMSKINKKGWTRRTTTRAIHLAKDYILMWVMSWAEVWEGANTGSVPCVSSPSIESANFSSINTKPQVEYVMLYKRWLTKGNKWSLLDWIQQERTCQ